MFSHRCRLALRLMLLLSSQPSKAQRSIRSLSAELGVSPSYAARVARALADGGFVVATQGAHGGLALSPRARTATLLDVVHALDGPAVFDACALGLPACSDTDPCPLHAMWAPSRGRLRALLAVPLTEAALPLPGQTQIAPYP